MGKSARILGEEYGMSSQEMNVLLKNEGFLDGNPGDYTPTEKGLQFATEKDFHRGTGGYAQYNRDWTTRTWDDCIKDVLDVTPEKKQAARDAIASASKHASDVRRAEVAKAEANFLATGSAYISPKSQLDSEASTGTGDNNLMKAVGIGAGIALIVYGIYKAAPHIKHWWKNNVVPSFAKEESSEKDHL